MIVVLVGNQDRVDRGGLNAAARESSDGIAERKPAVSKNAGGSDLDQHAVALAAAA